jgi:hypothetical protein
MSTTPKTPVAHPGAIEIGANCNVRAPEGMGLMHVRYARYPGCQQLQVWLPQPGREGYSELRVAGARGKVLEQSRVEDRLNGSVQLLFDTLAWPPGPLVLEISHEQGWRHRLEMHKLRADEQPTAAPQMAASGQTPTRRRKPITYRDGFGRVIVEQDLLLRQAASEALAIRLARRLVYEGYFRAGTFTYIEGELRIRFSQEMGAAPCQAVLDVPRAEHWQAHTGTPLQRRDEIMGWVAEQATRQIGGSRFEIGAAWISIF